MNVDKFMKDLKKAIKDFKSEASEYGKIGRFDIHVCTRYMQLRAEVEDENDDVIVVTADLDVWDSDGLREKEDELVLNTIQVQY